MPPSLRLVASGSTNRPKKPSRRIRTCSLTHSANHVPLNAAANTNEATCPAHQQHTQRARAANANHGAYREDAAAVVGLPKLLQGAGELSGAKLGPVDHWGDAGETARGWACVTRVLSFARACRLHHRIHVCLWRLQRSTQQAQHRQQHIRAKPSGDCPGLA